MNSPSFRPHRKLLTSLAVGATVVSALAACSSGGAGNSDNTASSAGTKYSTATNTAIGYRNGSPTPTPTATSTATATATATPTPTKTPIKHVVVIVGENVSFDHYFATYPNAANVDGTPFKAAPNTPKADTLASAHLLTKNPNAYQPRRLTPAQALTCDQNHSYQPEQKAVNNGAMDKFVENTSTDTCTGAYGAPGLAMSYFDGNTVTAYWNYAQKFAMSDNSWATTFGPSTPGALNLVSGQTYGAKLTDPKTGKLVVNPKKVAATGADGVGAVIADPDPALDDCSNDGHTTSDPVTEFGSGTRNIGDLLNAKHATWGWFSGGFKPTKTWTGKSGDFATCDAKTKNFGAAEVTDYIPHHEPFQYFKSTANPHHLPPTSVAMIGHQDQANHQYDMSDFDAAVTANNLPAVSFVKAPAAQDGHAAYSDPLDEQKFVVQTINSLQHSKDWSSTAIVIAYDDSDGWYDHVAPKIANASTVKDLDAPVCGDSKVGVAGGLQGRCGPSQRLPLLVISPFSKENFVDHTATEQTSVLKFIEDNWATGRLGGNSFDERAGGLESMFDFKAPARLTPVLLKSDGSVQK